jgi:LmbE family N-acetylglucosaminyl deacetylase
MSNKLGRRVWRLWVRIAGRQARRVLDEIEHLPLADARVLLSAGPILVMAPHPDDESLGCGGLLAIAAQQGVPARIIFMTDGSGSHPGSVDYPPEALRILREREAVEAAEILGLGSDALVFLGQPDGVLSGNGPKANELVARIVEEGRRLGVASVLSTWIFDGHPDHVATALIARRVARKLSATLYYYPIWGLSLDGNNRLPTWSPPTGWRIDVSAVINLKKQAIARHQSQMTGLIDDSTTAAPTTDVFAAFDQSYERYMKDKG